MTEHKQLKEINDLIGYEPYYHKYITEEGESFYARIDPDDFFYTKDQYGNHIESNVREIIFTQDFIDKLEAYVNKQNKTHFEILWHGIRNHLDNPTEYIYKLLELGNNQSENTKLL